MHTKAPIALTLLALCAFVGFGLLHPKSPFSNSNESAAHGEASPAIASADALRFAVAPDTPSPSLDERPGNDSGAPPSARGARDSETSAPGTRQIAANLDNAPPAEIRRTLEAALDAARERRPIFMAPGLIDEVASGNRVRVIFDFGPYTTETMAGRLLAGDNGGAAYDSLRVFPRLARGAAAVGPRALLALIRNSTTRHIELDRVHRPSLLETIPIIQADLSHQASYDGDGFAVAVLDTGVDTTHPFYADRLIEEACFSALADCPNGQTEMFGPGAAVPCAISGCGHGTRVAGIALTDQDSGPLRGAAPHANLIAIQIFSDVGGEPGAYASDILAGLQHVLDLTAFHSIASANLSLGGTLYTSEASCDQASTSQGAAVSFLRAAGVLTIAAAGNEGFTNALTTPGCLSNVIAVGSTSDNDVVSNYSNSATFLGLLAPGESVTTASTGGGLAISSGTSMATPHVSGAIATIREAMPLATADEIENALALAGLPVLDTRNGVTTPRIQVQDTIDLLDMTMSDPGDPGDPPPGNGGGSSGSAATTSASGGGGGGCGLVGLEPFLILGLIRLWPGRGRNPRESRSRARRANHHQADL